VTASTRNCRCNCPNTSFTSRCKIYRAIVLKRSFL